MGLYKDSSGQLVIAGSLPPGGSSVSDPATTNLVDTAPWFRALDAPSDTSFHPANYYSGTGEASNSLAGYLTNPAVTLPANSAGVVSSYAAAVGTFKVFLNGTDITTSCTFDITSSTSISASINANTGYYSVTDVATDIGYMTLRATYKDQTQSLVFTATKAKSSTSTVTAIVEHESHAFYAYDDGTVPSYSGSGTIIRVYEGDTVLVYDGTGTTAGKWKVTTSGSYITPGSLTDSGDYVTVGDHSGFDAANDVASITYTITGKDSAGTSFTLTKKQSFSKSKQGTIGSIGYQPTFVGCKVYHDANQTLSSGTQTVSFNSELYDSHGFHSTSTNNSRITVPTGEGLNGYYLLLGSGYCTNGVYSDIFIFKNGSAVAGSSQTENYAHSISSFVYLAEGDYVELKAYGASSHTWEGAATPTQNTTSLTAVRIAI